MLIATVAVLVVLLVAAVLLVVVTLLRRRPAVGGSGPGAVGRGSASAPGLRSGAPGGPGAGGPGSGGPALGSPAQVWVERGESVAGRLADLATSHPVLGGAADDAQAVLAELRAAATEVAALDAARASTDTTRLRAERQRLDTAVAAAAGQPTEADLSAARDAVDARIALAGRHRAAVDALLVRMRAAVAGLEQAHDELVGLMAQSATGGTALTAASTDLADRLAGLRAGIAEVRVISGRSGVSDIDQGQGLPGDVPGSVEGPPRT